MMITWFILPIVCMIAVAVYLYRKIRVAVLCFTPEFP